MQSVLGGPPVVVHSAGARSAIEPPNKLPTQVAGSRNQHDSGLSLTATLTLQWAFLFVGRLYHRRENKFA